MKRINWGYWIAGQAGVVPLAYGMPGVAKTDSAKALAKASGREFISFVLQHHMPEDFGGFPVVREVDGREVMRRIPDEKLVLAQTQPCVVLFDELTNAGHAVQGAALLLIQEGIPGSWLFAAANPPAMAAAGVDLSAPMVNRLCILQWETDPDAWDAGCELGFQFGAPSMPILPDGWQSYCFSWGPLLSAFRKRFPDLWAAFPDDAAQASEPYPTPRSWRNAGVLCAAAESVQAGDVVRASLVYGCVGQKAGTVFLRWVEELNLPDPEMLLRNPGSLKLPTRGDHARAIVFSVMNRVKENNSPARWESGRDFLEAVWGQSQEFAMAADGLLWSHKPQGYTPVTRNGVSAEIAKAKVALSS